MFKQTIWNNGKRSQVQGSPFSVIFHSKSAAQKAGQSISKWYKITLAFVGYVFPFVLVRVIVIATFQYAVIHGRHLLFLFDYEHRYAEHEHDFFLPHNFRWPFLPLNPEPLNPWTVTKNDIILHFRKKINAIGRTFKTYPNLKIFSNLYDDLPEIGWTLI